MKTGRLHYICFFVGILLLDSWMISCSSPSDTLEDSKPNIIIIMADDMGYSDLGCYGSEIETPNLDKLAANGIKFTQFYNAGRCSPSRASLLTGLYPHKAGVGWLTTEPKGNTAPGYRGNLSSNAITIPEILKTTGYATYMSGKWHVTEKQKMESKKPDNSWPNQRGFDQFFGTINGLADYFIPVNLKRNNTSISYSKGFYYTDAISDTASYFIKKHHRLQKDQPFFMYVAYTAPHFPLQARSEDIAKYEKLYLKGWDSIRQSRYEKMKQLGIIDESESLVQRDPEVIPWEELPKEKKVEMAKRMAIYAAQVAVMDQGIGRIIATLEKTGNLENTVLLFLSDNGASAEYKSELDPNPKLLGTAKSYESYRKAWAHVSNTPFKRYKHWVHEGGIATPFIVSWPKKIKGGKSIHKPGHIIDILPTCIAIAGIERKTVFGKKKLPDGISLKPLLQEGVVKRDTLFWEHEGNRAIRIGDWKLVSRGKPIKPYTGSWQLFDLKNDRTEIHNVSEQYPGRVNSMAEAWEHWAERSDVYPLDGRGGSPRRDTTGYAIQKEKYGIMPDGRQVDLFTLKNYDGVKIKITNYGGIITKIITPDKNQHYKDIVLGFDTFQEYLTKNGPHFGALIGRYANRIAYGKFNLDGKTHNLPKNRPPHHLHTGDERGFDKVLWDAEVINENDQEKLRLKYTSPNGNEGYPGKLKTIVDYYLTEKSELVIDYQAETDKPTIVNLTNHSYFNLSGRQTKQLQEYGVNLEKYNQIMDHQVYIQADDYTPIDKSLIPTGEILPVKNTRFDFTKAIAIQDANPKGFDHNFVLRKKEVDNIQLAAKVRDPKTGRTLEIYTTQPGLQFYTGNFLSKKIIGKKGRALQKYGAFCLETQNFPDAPHHTNFPSPVLRPGEKYKHKTIYKFDVIY